MILILVQNKNKDISEEFNIYDSAYADEWCVS